MQFNNQYFTNVYRIGRNFKVKAQVYWSIREAYMKLMIIIKDNITVIQIHYPFFFFFLFFCQSRLQFWPFTCIILNVIPVDLYWNPISECPHWMFWMPSLSVSTLFDNVGSKPLLPMPWQITFGAFTLFGFKLKMPGPRRAKLSYAWQHSRLCEEKLSYVLKDLGMHALAFKLSCTGLSHAV